MPYNANQNELDILKYWEKHQCFEKSVSSRPEKKPYVFYDGPPFATGLPHYGHILSSVVKDVVPRYWTMKGYRVRRRWGWDCHGLPIESLVEKELGISGKKEIEDVLGVKKFNNTCRSKVLLYTKEWKKMIDRIGRWIEFDNSYKTMDSTYMESVWWALKTIWEKGLIYEGRKVLMYCPRCETPVSKAEVAMDNSYKDITEEAVTLKFKIKPGTQTKKLKLPEDTYILAWTTTPWTLPGNVALAVGENLDYVLIEGQGEKLILSKDRLSAVMDYRPYNILKDFKGIELVGLEYEPLYEIKAIKDTGKKAWYVTSADFVNIEEGTGIVHTAVVYGEEDYELGLKIGLPVVPLVNEKGRFNELAPDFIIDKYFKDSETLIKDELETRNLLFSRENHTHSYPHCWRCDTQLFYNAVAAWFINIQKIKDRMIALNEKINWFPTHLKHGRFLNILETAPDWNISRNRYWATPLPFWRCDSKECNHVECIGSVKELTEKASNFSKIYDTDDVEKIDLHKHEMDKVKLKCPKCNKEMSRVSEVIDCWVESASMPFAEFHYPFENREVFEKRFPGQYIGEYIAQTRAWFYYMHVMAVLLFDGISFENCVVTGTILNDKGEKLSKSKMNYIDPWVIIEQYGIDALRYYLMTSVVMQADNLFFSDREVRDVYNKIINTLHNVLLFYKTYAGQKKQSAISSPVHVLDKWISARLNQLVKETTEQMDRYDMVKAGRPLKDFIDDLSTWYVRRSRDRFKGNDEQDKQQALSTLGQVLITVSKIMAPITPFISEKVYQELKGTKESVHLEDWPEFEQGLIDEKILSDMVLVRKIVEMALALRMENGIKVRQPLAELKINNDKLSPELLTIMAEELNVKQVVSGTKEADKDWRIKEDGGLIAALNISITDDLRKEGLVREIVRTINQVRKDLHLTIEDRVVVRYSTDNKLLQVVFQDFTKEISKAVLANEVVEGEGGEEIEIGDSKVSLSVEKVI